MYIQCSYCKVVLATLQSSRESKMAYTLQWIRLHPDYCKVVLATLRTELTQIQDGGYTAVDPTSPGLSMLY